MQWTCQTEPGPLWWRIENAGHWYRSDTAPEELAADYRRAHPHIRGQALVLTWWKDWKAIGCQVRVGVEQETATMSLPCSATVVV